MFGLSGSLLFSPMCAKGDEREVFERCARSSSGSLGDPSPSVAYVRWLSRVGYTSGICSFHSLCNFFALCRGFGGMGVLLFFSVLMFHW